ncbi:hypothetical protein MMC34_007542 [Xylographa carneopallida]|nr:hypothetical protein [Xylographa carneopallida]
MDDRAPRSFQRTEHDLALASLGEQYLDAFVTNSALDLPFECPDFLLQEEPRAECYALRGHNIATDFLVSPFDPFRSVQASQLEFDDFSSEHTGVFSGAWIDLASTIGSSNQQQPDASLYFTPSETIPSMLNSRTAVPSMSNSRTAVSSLSERSTMQRDYDMFLFDMSKNDPMIPFNDTSSTLSPQKRKRKDETISNNTLDSQQFRTPRKSKNYEIEGTNQCSFQLDGGAPLESGSVFAACHLWLSTHPNQHPPEYVISGLAFAFLVPFDRIRQWFRFQLRDALQSSTPTSQTPPKILRNDPPSSVAIAACHIWLSTRLNVMPADHVIFALSLAFDSSFDSLCDWFRTQLKPYSQVRIPLDCSSAFSYRTNQHKCNRDNYDDGTMYFTREKEKPYACTSRCGRNFRTKDDWRKHEEINYPQRIWLCKLPGCAAKSQEKRVKFRKEHFKKHLELCHNGETLDQDEVAESCVTIDSIFDRECLFHGCHTMLHTWKDRINHIAKHFSTQSWTSSEWRLPKDSIVVADG